MFNMNGPPKGANVTSNQSAYDIVFKDVIVKSENRNKKIYPNPNTYNINLTEDLNKIYKAEIIAVNVPAATDITVNITSTTNRLYFDYNGNYGYVKIQAGTYLNPVSVAEELQRQFNLLALPNISVTYNINLNRYSFVTPVGIPLTLYPDNGTTIPGYTVQDSISQSLNLQNDPIFNTTTDLNIINVNGVLQVIQSNDYSSYNGTNVIDPQFNNTILSNQVLTSCNIYLSLGILNSNTIQFVNNENKELSSNVSRIFCEIPNNTIVSSVANKTLLNQPCVWSGMNFYNPPVPILNKLEIKWYNDNGNFINILDHCFTIRIYYLQKRNGTSEFSVPIVTYGASGTIDSMFG